MNTNENNTIPTTALVLGIAGLIPFIAGALVALFGPPHIQSTATFAVGAYAAVILSFLGGVKWGILLDDTHKLRSWLPITLSVIPSIVAWVALLLSYKTMLLVLAAGLVLQYIIDQYSVTQSQLPPWFGKLRTILSIGATACVLAALVAYS